MNYIVFLFIFLLGGAFTDGGFLDSTKDVYRFQLTTFKHQDVKGIKGIGVTNMCDRNKKGVIKYDYYMDNWYTPECDEYDSDNSFHSCCYLALNNFRKNSSEKFLECYSSASGGGGGVGGGYEEYYMYNCFKTSVVDIKKTALNKKVFIGVVGCSLFIACFILVFIFFGKDWRKDRGKVRDCWICFCFRNNYKNVRNNRLGRIGENDRVDSIDRFDRFDSIDRVDSIIRLELLDEEESNIGNNNNNNINRFGNTRFRRNSSKYSYDDCQDELLLERNISLSHIGNKINGGKLSFFNEDELVV